MGKKKLSIEILQKKAKKHGGKCLSKKYINKETKYKWMCAKGHIWWAIPSLHRDSWCLICAGKEKRTIEEMKKLAKERGGKCLSKKYININSKLKWICINNHIWFARPISVTTGSWCPNCNFYLSEAICRTTFEQIFKVKFSKSYPKWLKKFNSKSRNLMELDGYNEKLKIAFEYNGEQHYKKNFFNSNKRGTLKKQILNDKLKLKLCKKNNVRLFIISYKDDLINLPELIRKKALKFNINIKNLDFKKEINFNKVWLHKINIIDMKNLAKERNGKCLSKKYIGAMKKLKWQCSEGHIWMASPASIKTGRWCNLCGYKTSAKKLSLGILKMQEVAEKKGGKCLSKDYVNNKSKLKWECSKGHTWYTVPANIMNKKSWCPICANKFKGKKVITDMAKKFV